jgi:hypothetical protein
LSSRKTRRSAPELAIAAADPSQLIDHRGLEKGVVARHTMLARNSATTPPDAYRDILSHLIVHAASPSKTAGIY